MAAPINWDGTTAADVRDYVGPTPGVTGGGGFIDNFVSWSDAVAAFLANGLNLNDFVTASDYAGATAMHAPQAPAEIATASGEAIAAVGDAAASAAKNAASSTLSAVGPYLLAAGLIWVAVEVRRGR